MHHHTLASLYHHTVMVCISKPQIGGYIVPLSNYLTAKSCLVAFFLVPQSPSRVLKPRGLLIWHFAQDVSKDHAVENLLAWKVLELGRSVERVLLGHRGVIPHRYLNVYIYIIISLSLCYIYSTYLRIATPKERQKYRKVVQFWNPMLLFCAFLGVALCIFVCMCV